MRRLGYLLDDVWYGLPPPPEGGRDALKRKIQALTLEEVNAAVRRHLRADRLRVVVVTHGAAPLQKALVDNTPSAIEYPAAKPAAILEEDKAIQVYDLELDDKDVRVVTPDALFAR